MTERAADVLEARPAALTRDLSQQADRAEAIIATSPAGPPAGAERAHERGQTMPEHFAVYEVAFTLVVDQAHAEHLESPQQIVHEITSWFESLNAHAVMVAVRAKEEETQS